MVPLRKSTVRTVSVRISSTRPPQSTWLREGCAHLWCPVEPYRSCGATVMPLPSLEIANDRQQSAPISSNRQNRTKNRRIFASWKKRDRRGAGFQQRFKARGCHLTNSSFTDPLLILYWSYTDPLLCLCTNTKGSHNGTFPARHCVYWQYRRPPPRRLHRARREFFDTTE